MSRIIVISRSAELIKKGTDFENSRKKQKKLTILSFNGNKKRKSLLKMDLDTNKLRDLEHLKQQKIPGEFSTAIKVQEFYILTSSYKEKQDHLYIKVRYAKAT